MSAVTARQYFPPSCPQLGVTSPAARRTCGLLGELVASQSVSLGHQPCSVQYKSTVGRCAGHFLPAPVPHTAYALGCGWRFHTMTRGRSLGLLMKKFSFAVAQFLQLVCRQCECNTFVSSQCSHMSENHCQNLLWLHTVWVGLQGLC